MIMVDDAELALVDALSDKADLSYKLEWKNDLRLLKMKNIKKVVWDKGTFNKKYQQTDI